MRRSNIVISVQHFSTHAVSIASELRRSDCISDFFLSAFDTVRFFYRSGKQTIGRGRIVSDFNRLQSFEIFASETFCVSFYHLILRQVVSLSSLKSFNSMQSIEIL